ncbi:MAG: hypothetical protein FCKEOINB_01145 [Nitrosomonas sp.]|nr:hypothetical protein [Nitrosomonas sp.]
MSELALQLIHENIKKHQRGEDARSLDLGNCGLTGVPVEIGQCTWLEALNFARTYFHWDGKNWIVWQSQNTGESNHLSQLPNSFSGLKNLKRLVLGGPFDRSVDLNDISIISELKNLQEFYFWNTGVSDLSPLAGLSGLQKLDCRSTSVSDLSPLAGLSGLQILNCNSTSVSDLSPLAQRIKSNIPVVWKDQYASTGIFIRDCPLIIPPLEFAAESSEAVYDYFVELGHDGRKLNEVKIIFLGEASAGKTSLVKRLMNDDFNPEENQTHGIRIRKMPFIMNDGDTVNAHL